MVAYGGAAPAPLVVQDQVTRLVRQSNALEKILDLSTTPALAEVVLDVLRCVVAHQLIMPRHLVLAEAQAVRIGRQQVARRRLPLHHPWAVLSPVVGATWGVVTPPWNIPPCLIIMIEQGVPLRPLVDELPTAAVYVERIAEGPRGTGECALLREARIHGDAQMSD